MFLKHTVIFLKLSGLQANKAHFRRCCYIFIPEKARSFKFIDDLNQEDESQISNTSRTVVVLTLEPARDGENPIRRKMIKKKY